jgi:hypothetical protein
MQQLGAHPLLDDAVRFVSERLLGYVPHLKPAHTLAGLATRQRGCSTSGVARPTTLLAEQPAVGRGEVDGGIRSPRSAGIGLHLRTILEDRRDHVPRVGETIGPGKQ